LGPVRALRPCTEKRLNSIFSQRGAKKGGDRNSPYGEEGEGKEGVVFVGAAPKRGRFVTFDAGG